MKLAVYLACFVCSCGLAATPLRAQTTDTAPMSSPKVSSNSAVSDVPPVPTPRQKTIHLEQPIVLERIPHHYPNPPRLDVNSCAVASDQSDGKKSRVGIGVFLPTGSTGFKSDAGLGLIYEYLVKPGASADLVLTIGLNYYHSSSNVLGTDFSADILIIPVMVEYQFHIAKHFYAGPALGYNSVTVSVSGGGDSAQGNGSSLAYGITLGYQQKSLFTEARYLGSDKSGDTGLMLLVGGRF